MLDLKLIRSDPERVKAALGPPRRRRRRSTSCSRSTPAAAQLLPEVESAQAERKTLSKQIGEAKAGRRGRRAELMATVQELKEKIETGKEPSWRRSRPSSAS